MKTSKVSNLHKAGLPFTGVPEVFVRCLIILMVISGLLLETGCNKTVTVTPPVTSINSGNVYLADYTAIAAVTGIYSTMSSNFISGGPTKISVYAGLSADELSLYTFTNKLYNLFYSNKLTAINGADGGTWNTYYQLIYRINAAVEGLTASGSLTPAVKQQLLGEAKFCRAFCYFYLTNLYGDIPLALSSDPKVNSSLSRSPAATVYQQIITDLKDAQSLLNSNFVGSDLVTTTTERVRPSKAAANALLARVYLYTKDYANAAIQATAVIDNKTLYDTVDVNQVFLKNSKETLWALQPVVIGLNTSDAPFFVLNTTTSQLGDAHPMYLSNFVLNNFEAGDRRRINWVGQVNLSGKVYNYPYKYKVYLTGQAVTEYTIVLRLAEMYLIRAEAEVQLGTATTALSDLNVIRRRAGLTSLNITDKASLLAAVAKERQTELFTEWGHRWLDLKRTGTVDAVMNIVAPQKSSTWNTNMQLFPIPSEEIIANSKLTQNPGY